MSVPWFFGKNVIGSSGNQYSQMVKNLNDTQFTKTFRLIIKHRVYLSIIGKLYQFYNVKSL